MQSLDKSIDNLLSLIEAWQDKQGRGLLIAFSGANKTGKTILSIAMHKALAKVKRIRQPGSLDWQTVANELTEEAKLFTVCANRAQAVSKYTKPWLDQGLTVIADGYEAETAASFGWMTPDLDDDYSQLARELALQSTLGIAPDIVVYLTADLDVVARRLAASKDPSLLEELGKGYFNDLLSAYEALYQQRSLVHEACEAYGMDLAHKELWLRFDTSDFTVADKLAEVLDCIAEHLALDLDLQAD